MLKLILRLLLSVFRCPCAFHEKAALLADY
jgi:hypothetical protein